jgi:hypothetical protein
VIQDSIDDFTIDAYLTTGANQIEIYCNQHHVENNFVESSIVFIQTFKKMLLTELVPLRNGLEAIEARSVETISDASTPHQL